MTFSYGSRKISVSLVLFFGLLATVSFMPRRDQLLRSADVMAVTKHQTTQIEKVKATLRKTARIISRTQDVCVPAMTHACGNKYDESTCQLCLKREFNRRFLTKKTNSSQLQQCWLKHSNTLCQRLFAIPTNEPTATPTSSPTSIDYTLACKAAFVTRCPDAYISEKCLRCLAHAPSYTLNRMLIFEDFGDAHPSNAMNCTVRRLKKLCRSTTSHSNGSSVGFREYFAPPGMCASSRRAHHESEISHSLLRKTRAAKFKSAVLRCLPLAAAPGKLTALSAALDPRIDVYVTSDIA
jgi:hypothetical protein